MEEIYVFNFETSNINFAKIRLKELTIYVLKF